ncbi:hypothetical protein [Alkaliphilus transvaalensis]|uniref:hypothetical protein n=1 Tax=Alkaliphilus transvaalensis TaxID=114628 RepID=UPI0012EB2FAB|nr:hypothetical protein [Alkaliphilus transvaalensis]
MKRFKGTILSLAISALILNSALVWGNINLNNVENPSNGGGFTLQQDPDAKIG